MYEQNKIEKSISKHPRPFEEQNPRIGEKIKSISFDGRNSIAKLPTIIKNLREFGFKDGDKIPHDDAVYQIQLTCGLDPRTVRKYIALLLGLKYLKPSTKHQIEASKRVRITSSKGVSVYTVSTPIGYTSYTFGPRAPKLYEETLNPKYVPPHSPPSTRVLECQSQNNMCAERLGGESKGDSIVVPSIDGSREGRERERVGEHTHIIIEDKYETNIKSESNGCPYIATEDRAVVCTATFWSGLENVHRPILTSEILLCKTQFMDCPDYQAKAEGSE